MKCWNIHTNTHIYTYTYTLRQTDRKRFRDREKKRDDNKILRMKDFETTNAVLNTHNTFND